MRLYHMVGLLQVPYFPVRAVRQVNISEATYELVKNEPGLAFTARGKVQAKGKGDMEMYFASSV